jgi:hypothetical protein
MTSKGRALIQQDTHIRTWFKPTVLFLNVEWSKLIDETVHVLPVKVFLGLRSTGTGIVTLRSDTRERYSAIVSSLSNRTYNRTYNCTYNVPNQVPMTSEGRALIQKDTHRRTWFKPINFKCWMVKINRWDFFKEPCFRGQALCLSPP